jgi:hypothetical protein
VTHVVLRTNILERWLLGREFTTYLEAVCAAGVEGARRRVRVDTGELRDSIRAEVRNGQGRWGSDVRQAAPNEFGTYKMRAQPFLRPSIDDARREAIRLARRSER